MHGAYVGVTVVLGVLPAEFGDRQPGFDGQVVHDLVNGLAIGETDGDISPRVAGRSPS